MESKYKMFVLSYLLSAHTFLEHEEEFRLAM